VRTLTKIPAEDMAKLPAFTAALAAQLKKNAIVVDEPALQKAILAAFDNMAGGKLNCDQCANGWKW